MAMRAIPPQEVAFPVWLMSRLGVDVLITTNAAGAINESFHVGFLHHVGSDQPTGRNPVAASGASRLAPRFFSVLDAFDPQLRRIARKTAVAQHVRVCEGVYLGLLGPSFETPSEIRAFRALGADSIAMSVCEEVIAARHVGMRVLGISLLSNMACGIAGASPSDAEVIDVAATREDEFRRLITGIIESI